MITKRDDEQAWTLGEGLRRMRGCVEGRGKGFKRGRLNQSPLVNQSRPGLNANHIRNRGLETTPRTGAGVRLCLPRPSVRLPFRTRSLPVGVREKLSIEGIIGK